MTTVVSSSCSAACWPVSMVRRQMTRASPLFEEGQRDVLDVTSEHFVASLAFEHHLYAML